MTRLRLAGARARGEPADDRETPRSHAGADDRALSAPRPRLGEGVRGAYRR